MSTIRAVRVETCGAAEQMTVQNVPEPTPDAGQVRVRMSACGINLIDTYHRSGLYPLPLPTGLGCEGAGVVDAVGEGVDDLAVGERVALRWPWCVCRSHRASSCFARAHPRHCLG